MNPMNPPVSPEPGTGEARGASVIVNVIAVLRCFSEEQPVLGVTEIAARVGLHKSTVSRILATLEAENLVEQDPETRRYMLGLGLIAIAGPLLADLDVRRIAHPLLLALTERTGETSALMLWDHNEAICVEQIPSPHKVKHTTSLGTRYSDALSASMQIFLANEPPERIRTLLISGAIALPGLDDRAVQDYLLRLKVVADRGSAINDGETSLDEAGVAAPVYDHRGQVVAAVLAAAPRFRVSPEILASLGESCAATAHGITARLGATREERALTA